jgi:peptidoglycan/LPS O-acetylase OafA/YrhL
VRDNNFDTMRLVAALAVIVSHAFPLSYGPGSIEPMARITGGQSNLGQLAVVVFFVLSGYLITGSFHRQTPLRFVLARALRILPGLALVLLVLAFVLGPLMTALPSSDYLASALPWRYVGTNLSLTGFVHGLPGVFDGNPLPHAVDASLWTLRYEAQCYGLVFVLGIAGLLTRWVVLGLLLAALAASRGWLGGEGFDINHALFASYFLGGAAFCLWRPPLRWWLALGAAGVLAIAAWWGLALALATAGAYLVLYVGLAPAIRLPKVTRWGDLSYGTYVWAFPVQQLATLALGAWASWFLNLVVALPVTLALAVLSWHLVERPALALRAGRPGAERRANAGWAARQKRGMAAVAAEQVSENTR